MKNLCWVHDFLIFYFWFLHLKQRSNRQYLCNQQWLNLKRKIRLQGSIGNATLLYWDSIDLLFVSCIFRWKMPLLNIFRWQIGTFSYFTIFIPKIFDGSWNYTIVFIWFENLKIEFFLHSCHCVCFSTPCLPICKNCDWITCKSWFEELIHFQLVINLCLIGLLIYNVIEPKIFLHLAVSRSIFIVLLKKLTCTFVAALKDIRISSWFFKIVLGSKSQGYFNALTCTSWSSNSGLLCLIGKFRLRFIMFVLIDFRWHSKVIIIWNHLKNTIKSI